MKKYGAKRDLNEAQIVRALRDIGATVHHISAPGLPDLMVGFRGNTYLMEVKGRKSKLTKPEQVFFDEWRGHAVIVRSVEDALSELGVVT